MKKIQILAVGCVAIALAAFACTATAATGQEPSTAKIAAVNGTATFSLDGTTFNALRANASLAAGAVIKTGADSTVDLRVNNAVIRVKPNTVLVLAEMAHIGSERDGDTETMLNVKMGSILTDVKKLSAASRFEITTPTVVAGVRGTSIEVTVTMNAQGQPVVSFTTLSGELICSAVVNTESVVKVLKSGEEWTPGEGDVVLANNQDVLNALNELADAVANNETITPGMTGVGGAITITLPPVSSPD